MDKPYLEVTYRQGRIFAAYLYLKRQAAEKSVRSERHGPWIVDFAADGRAIGIEFTEVGHIDLAELNRVLAGGHQSAVSRADLVPLQAA